MSLLRSAKILFKWNNCTEIVRHLSNKSAYFSKIHRKLYLRLYPTLIVEPDGSTYTVRHFEPRRIIKLPLDLRLLSEEEKAEILEKRRPKKKVVVKKDIADDFDSKQYLKFIKKRA